MTTKEAVKVDDEALLTEEETMKAKAEIGDEVYADAVEVDVEGNAAEASGTFTVTQEELSILRAELACEFPDDYKYLSDAYIKSVASKPYSKDTTVRRPIEYTMEKLTQVMQWRKEAGAADLIDLMTLANGPQNSPEALADPERLAMAKRIAVSLNNGAQYLHGFTKDGRPILWVRTNRKPWIPDSDADVKAFIILFDICISCMPKGVTDVVVIAESSSPPPPHPGFLIATLKALVRGYPDRLNLLISAPISSVIQFVMKLLLPLMPGMLASKICLKGSDEVVPLLGDLLLNGKDDIPTFFGGSANHDEFYPDEYYCPNRGKGVLKFDFFGMIERLKKAKDDYEASHPNAGETN